MPDYTYLAYDLLTNTPVAEVPLSGVSYSFQLDEEGTLTGTIPTGAAAGRADIRNLLPGRTAIYPFRDNDIIDGYILWDDDPQPGGIRINDGACRSLLSYFDRRRIRSTLTYTQQDQLAIAESLIDTAQAVPGGNIGVETLGTRSGVLRDRSYPASEIKNVREALTQLSAVQNGFDFSIGVTIGSDGAPRKVLNLGYPYLGRSQASTGLVLEYPGNVLNYTWTRLGSQITTTMWLIGAGDGESALRARADNNALLNAGWPVLESDISYTDVTEQSTLNAHALAEAAVRSGVVVTPRLTVTGDDPPLRSYMVGDFARVRITDDTFGGPSDVPAIDQVARINKITVTPSDDQDVETVSLELSAVVMKL